MHELWLTFYGALIVLIRHQCVQIWLCLNWSFSSFVRAFLWVNSDLHLPWYRMSGTKFVSSSTAILRSGSKCLILAASWRVFHDELPVSLLSCSGEESSLHVMQGTFSTFFFFFFASLIVPSWQLASWSCNKDNYSLSFVITRRGCTFSGILIVLRFSLFKFGYGS